MSLVYLFSLLVASLQSISVRVLFLAASRLMCLCALAKNLNLITFLYIKVLKKVELLKLLSEVIIFPYFAFIQVVDSCTCGANLKIMVMTGCILSLSWIWGSTLFHTLNWSNLISRILLNQTYNHICFSFIYLRNFYI